MKDPGCENFWLWIRNPCPLKLTDKALKPVIEGNAFNFMENTMAAWQKKCLCWPLGWPMEQFCCCISFFLPLPCYQAARSCFSGHHSTSIYKPFNLFLVSRGLKWELIDLANKALRDILSIEVIWLQSEMSPESVSGSEMKKDKVSRGWFYYWLIDWFFWLR